MAPEQPQNEQGYYQGNYDQDECQENPLVKLETKNLI